MSDGQNVGEMPWSGDIGEDSLVCRDSRLRPQTYVLWMLLIPLFFLASVIPIVRSSSFPLESGDPFLLHSDYPFSLKQVDCDVVIFGDSTAVTGLDPTVVSRFSGLKTCNIAQTQSIVAILGTMALDTYLANNSPPKFIVMQFAPETLSGTANNLFWPEGLTLLLRKKSLIEALPTFIEHPKEAYRFSIWAIKNKVESWFEPPIDFTFTDAIFRSHGGLLILPKPAQTRCLNDVSYDRPTAEWIHGLKQRYARNGTRVLINVSPLPACSPIAAAAAAGTRNVTDNSLSLYPIGLFCDLDRHLTLEGAQRASVELAGQIVSGKMP